MRRFASKLALALATTALLFGILEVATRTFSDLDRSLTVADPTVGRRYIAGFAGEIYVPEAGRRVLLRFHRDGFRGPDRPYEKPPEVRRVALVGDSFVLAAGVDEGRTMVGGLEALLNERRPEHRWEVMNFGVSGSSTGQELALYRAVVRRYRPDVVVCAFAVINDLADSSPRLSSSAALYFDLDERGELVQLPVRAAERSSWLNRHSRFYVWQKQALRELRFNLRQKAGVVKPGKRIYSTADDAGDLAHAWQLVARLIETFAREVEADSGRFVLMAVPAPEQIYDDRWNQILDNAGEQAASFDRAHPDRRLTAIAAAARVPLLTLVEDFRSRAPSASLEVEAEWLFLSGIGHLNEAGNRLAAVALFDAVTSMIPEPVGRED